MTQEEKAISRASFMISMISVVDPVLGAKIEPILPQLLAAIKSNFDENNGFSLMDYLNSGDIDFGTRTITGILINIILYYTNLPDDSGVQK